MIDLLHNPKSPVKTDNILHNHLIYIKSWNTSDNSRHPLQDIITKGGVMYILFPI